MKNSNGCQGPCLPHCYDNKIIFIIIGFFIGILCYIFIEKIITKYREDKKNEKMKKNEENKENKI